MATPAELFDRIAGILYGYCEAPETVIRVVMEFDRDPFGLSVIRHLNDPDKLFDNSRDTGLPVPEGQLAAIRAIVREYFEISRGWERRLLRTTLSVYLDGQWSVGSTSETKEYVRPADSAARATP